MTDGRSEILSIRLSMEEKRRLTEGLARSRSVLAAAGQKEPNLSDYAREKLLASVTDAAVFPGQNITVGVEPIPRDHPDVVRSLRLALAAAERMAQ